MVTSKIEQIKNNGKLTQREKVIGIIEATEGVAIVFSGNSKTVLCSRCREAMIHYDIVFDEHTEFECEYCGRNVKIPLYVWEDDEYYFPNEYYDRIQVPKAVVKAQSLAQAYSKLIANTRYGNNEEGVKLL